jgi:DNA-binding MarR family transcriptional regulator
MTQSSDDLQKCVEHIFWDLIDALDIPKGRKNELTLVTGIIIHMAAITELRMQDIATILGVSKSTVTDYINYLEKRGFVSRERGTEDRRDVFIVPTEKGREWVKRDRTIILNYTDEGLTRLTPEERKDFIRLLTKFVGDIDQPPYKNLLKNKDGEKAQDE